LVIRALFTLKAILQTGSKKLCYDRSGSGYEQDFIAKRAEDSKDQ
jgi:hypothetical protein